VVATAGARGGGLVSGTSVRIPSAFRTSNFLSQRGQKRYGTSL
jgi:hypothetical protein